jgi:selenocysteine lyase/cysteine desulfurase
LTSRNDCRVVGQTRNEGSARIPTVAFRFEGRDSGEVARAMDNHRIAIRHGDFHSRRLVEHLGLEGQGGVLRVSMVHYNTLEEVDRFCDALDQVLQASAA